MAAANTAMPCRCARVPGPCARVWGPAPALEQHVTSDVTQPTTYYTYNYLLTSFERARSHPALQGDSPKVACPPTPPGRRLHVITSHYNSNCIPNTSHPQPKVTYSPTPWVLPMQNAASATNNEGEVAWRRLKSCHSHPVPWPRLVQEAATGNADRAVGEAVL